MGSIRDARLAGGRHDTRVTVTRPTATTANVAGSVGASP